MGIGRFDLSAGHGASSHWDLLYVARLNLHQWIATRRFIESII
jgi:hypothetical protein